MALWLSASQPQRPRLSLRFEDCVSIFRLHFPNPLLAISQSSQYFLLLLCYHERYTRPGTLNLLGCHRIINEIDLLARVREQAVVGRFLCDLRFQWLTGFPLGDLSGRDFLSAGDHMLLARGGTLGFCSRRVRLSRHQIVPSVSAPLFGLRVERLVLPEVLEAIRCHVSVPNRVHDVSLAPVGAAPPGAHQRLVHPFSCAAGPHSHFRSSPKSRHFVAAQYPSQRARSGRVLLKCAP
jgi:hypothetical protein